MKDQLEKLASMITSYDNKFLPVEVRNRLAGLSRQVSTFQDSMLIQLMNPHSAMEEKIEELDAKLSRSMAERTVYTTQDIASISQIVRFITFSIEITTVS